MFLWYGVSASLPSFPFAITLLFSKVTVTPSSITTIHPSSDTATTFPFTMAVDPSKIKCTASLFPSTNWWCNRSLNCLNHFCFLADHNHIISFECYRYFSSVNDSSASLWSGNYRLTINYSYSASPLPCLVFACHALPSLGAFRDTDAPWRLIVVNMFVRTVFWNIRSWHGLFLLL